jgi:hypothetical protein
MDSFPASLPSEPDSGDEVRELIGEVAKRHNLVLAPGDPLFVVLTIIEVAAGRFLEKGAAILATEREASLVAMQRAAAASKAQAESLITAAAEYVAKTTRAANAELAVALTGAAAAERARVDVAAKDARRLLWAGSIVLAIVFAIVTGIAIGTWLTPEAKEPVLRCPSFTIPHSASSPEQS